MVDRDRRYPTYRIVFDGFERVPGRPNEQYIKTHIEPGLPPSPEQIRLREIILDGKYDPITRTYIEDALDKVDLILGQPIEKRKGCLELLRFWRK